ncbi:MAG TPA: TIM-barrel domain-containing protein, partial [Steroidobacteraceae bacterium]|nr:TIM-barrel domain-containing protein [Steroidobacteraceae bacterium]
NVIFYGDDTVRVNASNGSVFTTQPSLVVIEKPAKVAFTLQQLPESLSILSKKLRINVSRKTGALTFLKANGELLYQERVDQPQSLKKVEISGAPTYEVTQSFQPQSDESLYGLGQYNSPYMDYRGKEVLLVQTNIGIVVPFMMSTRRYGLLWDIYSKMTFKDDAKGATLWAESAPAGVDYYFIAGDDMDGVVRGYRKLTGDAPMLPKQAFGLFMSKERYKTQQQLLDVASTFRREQFPLDYIVQDWQYWGGDKDGTWSGMIWNKERFPDPKGLTKTLHDQLHLKLMASIWPSIGNDTELAHELDAKGLRFEPLHWISKQARVYDAFSPEGRKIYFKHIKSGLLDAGVDALWMDGTEVEVGGACHDPNEVEHDIKGLGNNALGDFTRYLNVYSLLTTEGTYQGQRATSDKRVFTLTRSAWAGQQRYAALPWSGDTTASWQTLRNQISGGINVAMAGLPYWTQDTGGFFVMNYPGGEQNQEYQELYSRWNQFGIFNPVYRIHGTSIEREPYLFKTSAPETYKSLLDAANLRYQLLPYIYSLGWQTTSNGYTMMRGIPMDFPDDTKARKLDDEFMFGPAFLVQPVTRAMYHVSDPPLSTIPADVLRTASGAVGMDVQYYSGVDFDRPAGKTVDQTVDHSWPGPPLANPPPGLDGFTYFSARWQGTLTVPETGDYELGLEFDDGGRLYVDNKLLIEDWTYGAKRSKSVHVALTKGQRVALKGEYHQGTGNRFFRIAWRTPTEQKNLLAEKEKKQLDNSMSTYLPAGAAWFDFWTHQRYAGGQYVKQNYTIDKFPVYVRAGSIVPMGPKVQFATEKPDAPYEIYIYPGADASFTIYEDDNETYAYEKGQRATFDLKWNDAGKTLSVGKRNGSFPALVKTRELKVILVDQAGGGTGVDAKTIRYTGQVVSVNFKK